MGSLLRRLQENRMPRPGETVRIYHRNRLLAAGVVVIVDTQTVSIAGAQGLIDLDTTELRRGLRDGTITVERRYEE